MNHQSNRIKFFSVSFFALLLTVIGDTAFAGAVERTDIRNYGIEGTGFTVRRQTESFFRTKVFPQGGSIGVFAVRLDEVKAEKIETDFKGGFWLTMKARYVGYVNGVEVAAENIRVHFDAGHVRADVGSFRGVINTRGIANWLDSKLAPSNVESPNPHSNQQPLFGYVYAVEQGNLHYYRDVARNGTTNWDNRSGRKIGHGFNFKHVVSGGEGILYCIKDSGDLHYYRDVARNGTTNWDNRSGRKIGHGFNFKHVVSGGNGILYCIKENGDLHYYRDLARNGTNNWDDHSGRKIGHGFSFKHVVSGGNGILYCIKENGDLHYYRDVARNGTTNWDNRSGRKIGRGFNFKHVASGDNGILYCVKSNGQLLFYRDAAKNGNWSWADGSGNQIGTGWRRFQHVTGG